MSAAVFFSKHSKTNLQYDLKRWATQVLHQTSGRRVRDKEAQDFVDFQDRVALATAALQFVVDAECGLSSLIVKMADTDRSGQRAGRQARLTCVHARAA